MAYSILFGTFAILMVLGMPIAFCLGIASFATVLYLGIPPIVIFQQLKSGMVHINDQTVNDDCVNPFGGPGIAGNGGSVGGPADWEEYTQWQWITVKDTATMFPF